MAMAVSIVTNVPAASSLPYQNCRSTCDIFRSRRTSTIDNCVAFRGGPNRSRRFQECRSSPRWLIKCSASATEKDEPLLLRVAVSGVTELLRLFGGRKNERSSVRTGQTSGEGSEIAGALVISSADLVEALRSDYSKSYFLTGEFTETLYAENCFYKDPTVRFSGRDLYKRNLKLLVPFYEDPSLVLESIREERVDDESVTVLLADWRLRVYLKLPWKPFIAVDGLTTYRWDKNTNEFVSHVESWNITGLEAMAQLFTPSERAFWRNRRIVPDR